MLSLEELRADVESGAIDTVVVAFTDMQGRLHGQAAARRVLPRRDGRGARGGGLQLPARARDGDGSGARLRARELGAGLRRLRRPARPRDAAPDPVARGDGARARRRAVARRLAGAALAAAGAEGADGAGRRARLHADDGQRARVLSPPRDVRGGAREGVRRADALGAVHPRLPHPRAPPTTRRSCARSGTACRRPGCAWRPRRARPGRASRRSTSASPMR